MVIEQKKQVLKRKKVLMAQKPSKFKHRSIKRIQKRLINLLTDKKNLLKQIFLII